MEDFMRKKMIVILCTLLLIMTGCQNFSQTSGEDVQEQAESVEEPSAVSDADIQEEDFYAPMDGIVYYDTTREQASEIFGEENINLSRELENGRCLDSYDCEYLGIQGELTLQFKNDQCIDATWYIQNKDVDYLSLWEKISQYYQSRLKVVYENKAEDGTSFSWVGSLGDDLYVLEYYHIDGNTNSLLGEDESLFIRRTDIETYKNEGRPLN